jgi:adenylate cyclase
MNTERAKRKLSAILSADVKGYSRLMGEDEVATVRTLKEYRDLMSKLIKEYRGRVVDSPGDNVLAEFASVVDALECSIEIQKVLKDRNASLPDNRKMEFRIGVNLGDVIEDEDRVYGDGVNIAARIEGLAEPGGICISGSGFEQVRNKLPLGYQYLGEHTVKNIVQPIKVYRVLMEPESAGKVIGEKKPKRAQWRWAAVVVVVLVAGALALWNLYWRAPKIEPASKEKMAFPLPDKPSIAVLPFANMTGDASQEFLVDGLTENLITSLARVPQLFVIARNSTFVYKGKGVKVQQVAEDLGIQYVLEGSVQRSGDKVRITAQFIDALKGRHLWAAQYDREMKDLFQLTDEVTNKVLNAVYIKLTGREEAQLRQRKNPKNTESLLKAFEVIAAMRGLNPKDNAQAKRLAEELTTMDPDWSIGFTLLARAHYMDVVLGSSKSPKESLAKALQLAQKAVAMDESSPTNYDTLGYVLSLMGEHERALVEIEKGSTLCPSCSDSYMYMGYIQYCMDETDKAIASLQTALRLNPYPPPYYYLHLGNAYRHVGRYEEAIPAYKKAIRISPNYQVAYVGLVSSYGLLGREEEARSAAQELLRVNPKFAVDVWAKAMPYKNQEKLARFCRCLAQGRPEVRGIL